ncbi:hypothetical protein CHUAL_001155 [Chamberlinius hualienensis]
MSVRHFSEERNATKENEENIKEDNKMENVECVSIDGKTTTVDEGSQIHLSSNEIMGRSLFRYMLSSGRNMSSDVNMIENVDETPKCFVKLEKLAKHVLKKHSSAYRYMANRLIEQGLFSLSFAAVEEICSELFIEEQITWGRIVALCALCIEISKECKIRNRDYVALYTADCLWQSNSRRITKWINQLPEGWSSVEDILLDVDEEFETKPKPGLSTSHLLLLVTGLGLALTLSLIFLQRKT